MTTRVSTASMSTVMLAAQRRDSGGEKESGETHWDGFQHVNEVYPSGSIGNSQRFINNSITKDIPRARDPQESSPSNPYDAQSITSQNEQNRPAFQDPSNYSKYSDHPILQSSVKSAGGLQNGWPETSCQSKGLTSSGSTGAEPPKGLAHTHMKAEKKTLEGRGAAEHLINSGHVQMRSDSLKSSTLHLLATGSLPSFRRKKPQPWPNPRDSLGDIIETKNKNIKGKVWVAQGEALRLFKEQIRPQIEELLHHIEPPQCAPLFLTLYMIGKAESSASPIIMISCCDRKARKDAEATIRESDILQRYPQMRLGNSVTLLEANASLVTLTKRVSASYVGPQGPSSLAIHWSEEPFIGRRLELVDKANGGETVRLATGGPFVRIDKHMYQLTAFHIGQGDAGAGLDVQLDSDSDHFEYDGQSDTDEDGSDLEATAKDAPHREPTSTTLETDFASIPVVDHDTDLISEEHDGQDALSPRALLDSRSIDFFLARLPPEEAPKANNGVGKSESHHSLQVTEIGTPEPRTQVVVVTSYSHLTGTILPGTNRVKMHGFYGFQDLLTARLSSSIRPGDSGSAVVDAITGCWYGHVILGSAPDTIVYVVPSTNIFANILSTFGKPPALDIVSQVSYSQKVPQDVHQKQCCVSAANRSVQL